MGLTITGDHISGDHTGHTARLVLVTEDDGWIVSWLPGRLLDRNRAITAMVLADIAGAGIPQAGNRLWPHIEGWAAELGLTAPDALTQVSAPSGHLSAGKDDAELPDPEAGS
jgi:hypothetical protein